MSEADGQAALETYLKAVRAHLRGLGPAEAAETVEELRSHVLDRVEGQPTLGRVTDALAALGDPRELGRVNASERVAARAEGARSPLTLFGTAAQLAAVSLRGLFVFLVSLMGYALAAAWLIAALAKPLAPHRVGLWHVQDPTDSQSYSLALGLVSGPRPGHELLGWWIMPLGLALGLGLGLLTWLFDRRALRRMAGSRWGRGA